MPRDTHTHHLAAQVRDAFASHTPLQVCGGASKSFHVPAPHAGAQVLDVQPCTGLVSYAPSELVVTARAGTPLVQVQAALAERGQCLPFDPPHFAAAPGRAPTLGGMCAAGWSGPARASVGAVRDYVLGVEMINGRGELLRFGGQVMKNVAGYDISRLMVGSWGTLGVLTEISLKVLPVPPGDATLRFACNQDEALQRLHSWRSQPLPLHASLWLEMGGEAYLFLRLRGATAAVQAACRHLGGKRLEPSEAAALWQSCRDQQLPWFSPQRMVVAGTALWRLSVPPTTPPAPAWEHVSSPLVEWHGALRWVHAPLSESERLQGWAALAGGSAVRFGGVRPGEEGAFGPLQVQPQALRSLRQRIKQAFDPAGILNPGLVPALA